MYTVGNFSEDRKACTNHAGDSGTRFEQKTYFRNLGVSQSFGGFPIVRRWPADVYLSSDLYPSKLQLFSRDSHTSSSLRTPHPPFTRDSTAGTEPRKEELRSHGRLQEKSCCRGVAGHHDLRLPLFGPVGVFGDDIDFAGVGRAAKHHQQTLCPVPPHVDNVSVL